jgi:hypothetical protein
MQSRRIKCSDPADSGGRDWMELPDRSKGYFLGYLLLTHTWGHFSEAMVTCTLMGLPGR